MGYMDDYFYVEDENDGYEQILEGGTNVEIRMKDGSKYAEDFIGGISTNGDQKFAFEKICCDYQLNPHDVYSVVYTDFGYELDDKGVFTPINSKPDERITFEAEGSHFLLGVCEF